MLEPFRMGHVKMTVLGWAIAVACLGACASAAMGQDAAEDDDGDVASLSGIEVVDDPLRILPNEISASSFGFAKPILDTPRSVSFVSQETIELFGLSSVEDLGRVTPSVFTPSRYGIQGSVDVRGVSADTYIRGMKRLTLQGNARSVLAAMDAIEVVKGPPSPIYGMGKIGGYTNFTPKSGRAAIGGYLPSMQGFAQIISGTGGRERREFTAGVGGPMQLFGKQGGYYVFGLLEDSQSFYKATPYSQKLLQAATSIDRGIGRFRVEAGVNYQDGVTAGALSSRVTQDLVDNGRYIAGTPLVNLDLNGNGRIGYYEMHRASPVRGNLSSGNQPLVQVFDWPTDENGNYLPLDQFPKIPGIPESLYDYLTEHPEADPTGVLRAQGIGGPVPRSGYIPVGFFLDPRTVRVVTLTEDQRRRAGAHERELRALFTTGFFDLVYDENPDFTMKNQLFYDSMDQYKVSNQPLYLTNDVSVMENKFTVTKRLLKLPSWISVNTLGSINVRRTESRTSSGIGGDLSRTRVDITDPNWVDTYRTPNTTFATARDNPDLNNDGTWYAQRGKTVFTEYGIGLLFDVDFLRGRVNLLAGGRYDYSKARNHEYAGTYNVNTGTSENPGAFRTSTTSAHGSDSGTSWSVSLSYRAGDGIRPYVTIAHSSLTLDQNNNRINNEVIQSGHIGQAELKEYGVKYSALGERLFLSVANYEQTRTDVTADPDDPTLNAEVTSTRARGTELELKIVPRSGLTLSLFALKQETLFRPITGGTFAIDARHLGFMDVIDPETGEVIYPAEAFLYGGIANIEMPDGLAEFEVRPTQPERQAGATVTFQFPRGSGVLSGLGFTFSGNYQSDVCGGRLCLITLPSVKTYNFGVFKTFDSIDFKFDVTNVTDERYYNPRLYVNAADMLLSAMPGRSYALTAKVNFR